MEESTKTDVSSRRVKRLQSDTSLNKSSSLKSGEESIQVISNGTGSSSTENLVEEESSSRATKGSIRITKISKNSKTEPSKEAIKSPNKAVLSPVKATSPSSSPSSSSVSKDDFQGFEDINLGKKEGERRKEFLSFVENLTSEEWVEPEDDNKDEASERGEEEEEMTVDASQTSDTDSNQMEIDTGSDKAQDKTRDSDVDALEMDVVEEEQPTKNGVSGNGNNTRPKGGGAKVEYYCGACEAEVNDSEEAICCDGTCERWFHLRCSGLSQSEYNELGLDENAKWACSKCSGKPTPVTPAVTKPLLSVRKDLAKPIVTPASTKRKSVAKEGSAARGARIDISNPAFLKPFDFGWKRELVYRSTSDNTPSSKRHGDIYYYTPKGKKLRSLREILDHLAGTDLTQDNFTFHKEPIGLDDPDKEIIRDAKLKMAMRDPLSTPSPAVIKKATPKITKAPKQATPKVVPKLTATVSPLETGGTTVLKASASVTPRVVFKGKASMGGTVRTKITPKTQASTSQAQKVAQKVPPQKSPIIESSKISAGPNVVQEHEQADQSVTTDNPVTNKELVPDVEKKKKNKFRRYGLLANAKTRRKTGGEFSSSSDSDDCSKSGSVKPKSKEKISIAKAMKVLDSDVSPSHSGQTSQESLQVASPTEKNLDKSSSEENEVLVNKSLSPLVKSSLMTENTLLPSPLLRRPSPPEIQFRPGNPSSYGCQTQCQSPLPSVSYDTNTSCSFETVLIVEDGSSSRKFTSSLKQINQSSLDPPLIVNNGDSSFKIISVDSLSSDEPAMNYQLSHTTFDQSCNSPKKSSSQGRLNEEINKYRRGTEDSPVSLSSSSTEDLLLVDDEPGEHNGSPILMQNRAQTFCSPHRSPPILRPVGAPPPLRQCYTAQTTLNQPPHLYSVSPQPLNFQMSNNKSGSSKPIHSDKKKKTNDDDMEMGMLPPMWEPVPKQKESKLGTDVCSIRCLPAMGLIPTLQCVVCLCLYHPQCVGLSEEPSHDYKCKNCLLEKSKPANSSNGNKTLLLPPPLVPITTLSSSTSVSHSVPSPPKLQRMSEGKQLNPRFKTPVTKSTSLVGGVTTWLPPSSTVHMRGQTPISKFSPSQKPLPPTDTETKCNQPVQSLVNMNGKKYIYITKHNVLSVSPATTSGIPSDHVSTQVTTTAFDTNNTLATQAYGSPVLPKSQASPAATFIVGSPTSSTGNFQKPPGVLLVPYMAPQTTPSQMDSQQPQYIVVNGPTMTPGNIIIGNIPQQQPVPQPPESALDSPAVVGSKRQLESPEEAPAAKRVRAEKPAAPPGPTISPFFLQNMNEMSNSLVHAFRYLKVQELLRASRVCVNWQRLAFDRSLWETVRMKNSQVRDWEGFAATLNRTGTKHLDLRKILINEKADIGVFWGDCIKALGKVHSLLKLDLCRCTPGLVEQITAACPQLESITATTIKNGSVVNLKNLGMNLTELKLKAQGSMTVSNWSVLENLTKLKQLSITTVKNLDEVLPVIGKMTQLDALELGEMTNISESSVVQGFSALTKLKRLRLEKGQDNCPTDKIMEVISQLPLLVQLELINFDVKGRFSDSLALCTNIKILLIIPTYVTQSATTNHLVINGIGKLNQTLNHFIWGLTLELLRVTDLFIDQWELRQKTPASKTPSQPAKKICGDSIPVLKLTGGTETKDGKKGKDVTQVDVLQLPKLHKVLTSLLPTTKIILLKVPFSATWRQTISSTLQ